MSIEFPISRRWSRSGPIFDLKILIEVRTLRGFRGRHFVVDTGADFSAAPRDLAQQVGQEWDRLPAARVTGIGPGHVSAKLGRLPLRIGGIELTVRCLFLDQPNAPLILGCADVLDRFALTIDAGQGKIILRDMR